MLKNHSFLKRMKDNLNNMFSVKMGKYKNATMSVAYILAASLVILTPESMYGASSSVVAKAQVLPSLRIEEETDNAAIIQTNQNNDILSEVEGIQLLQGQNKENTEVLVTQAIEKTNQDAGEGEVVELQADEDSLLTAILVSEETSIEKKVREEYEELLINKENAEKVAEYINVQEAKELEALAERAAAALKAVEEQRAAEEAAAKAAAEEAARKAAEKAAAEKAAAEKAAAEKAAKEKAKKEEAAKAASSKKIGKYSSKEVEILERIVEAEATGEDLKGKMLVANVILNRVNSKKFPSSIEGVVFQKGQFSPIRDGRYYKVSIKDSTKEAVSRALQGEDYSQGALYFAARQKASSKNMRWFDSKLTYLFRHGGHEFFK